MADKTTGELPAVPIGELPIAPDIYDDTLIPVEQQGEARKMTGAQWKGYAVASVKEQTDAAKQSADAAGKSADAAAESARDAADVALHPPILKEGNDHWWIWDTELNDYKDSEIDAGVSLEVDPETITGEPGTDAKVENLGTKTDPRLRFTIPRGVQGIQGIQGVGVADAEITPGTDYATDPYDTLKITLTDGTEYSFKLYNAAATSAEAAKTAQTAAETAQKGAETAKNEATAQATAAGKSADAAAASQTAAKASEDAAKSSEAKAAESQTAAAKSSADALASQTAAKGSADAAKASQDAAKASEDAAADSEAAAGQSATEAAGSATEAAESAQSAKDYSGKPPVIGEDENWETWDAELGEYVTTGKPSRGEKGDKGDKGDPGKDGTGAGDMLASMYDPENHKTDIFGYVDNAVANVKIDMDDTVTAESSNAVKSSGIYAALQERATTEALDGKADRADLDAKQDKLTGTQGQVVGFDEEGNAVAQENKSSLSPVSVKIAQPPTKTEYIAGEEFDGAGMILEVVCEDGTHFATGDFTVDPSGPLEVGTERVTVKYTYGGKNLEATQTISVKRGVDVFGVCWDTTNPNTALTRLTVADDPNHLVTTNIEGEPSPAVGTEGGSSPFDAFLPWSGMEEYNVMSGGTLVKTGESSFTRSNDTVVYIPEFGYKAVFDGSKVYYYISSKPTEDCPKHPGSGKYVGKYATGSGYYSKTNLAPQVNMTRAVARTSSAAKGNGWSQWGFDTWCAITALYLVEWADWDSQTKIGKGYAFGNSAAINTGATDAMKYHTGRASGDDGKTQVMYRWIEGLWGNVWQWVDGYNANGTTPYVCLDPAKYKDDTNADGYTEIGVTLPASGWTKNLGESKSFNWAYCPNTSGGSDSTYIPDYVYSYTGWRVLRVGGDWSNASTAGLFYFHVSNTAASALADIGSRLLFNP